MSSRDESSSSSASGSASSSSYSSDGSESLSIHYGAATATAAFGVASRKQRRQRDPRQPLYHANSDTDDASGRSFEGSFVSQGGAGVMTSDDDDDDDSVSVSDHSGALSVSSCEGGGGRGGNYQTTSTKTNHHRATQQPQPISSLPLKQQESSGGSFDLTDAVSNKNGSSSGAGTAGDGSSDDSFDESASFDEQPFASDPTVMAAASTIRCNTVADGIGQSPSFHKEYVVGGTSAVDTAWGGHDDRMINDDEASFTIVKVGSHHSRSSSRSLSSHRRSRNNNSHNSHNHSGSAFGSSSSSRGSSNNWSDGRSSGDGSFSEDPFFNVEAFDHQSSPSSSKKRDHDDDGDDKDNNQKNHTNDSANDDDHCDRLASLHDSGDLSFSGHSFGSAPSLSPSSIPGGGGGNINHAAPLFDNPCAVVEPVQFGSDLGEESSSSESSGHSDPMGYSAAVAATVRPSPPPRNDFKDEKDPSGSTTTSSNNSYDIDTGSLASDHENSDASGSYRDDSNSSQESCFSKGSRSHATGSSRSHGSRSYGSGTASRCSENSDISRVSLSAAHSNEEPEAAIQTFVKNEDATKEPSFYSQESDVENGSRASRSSSSVPQTNFYGYTETTNSDNEADDFDRIMNETHSLVENFDSQASGMFITEGDMENNTPDPLAVPLDRGFVVTIGSSSSRDDSESTVNADVEQPEEWKHSSHDQQSEEKNCKYGIESDSSSSSSSQSNIKAEVTAALSHDHRSEERLPNVDKECDTSSSSQSVENVVDSNELSQDHSSEEKIHSTDGVESGSSSSSSHFDTNIEIKSANSREHRSEERTNDNDSEGDSSSSSVQSNANVADSNEPSQDHQSDETLYPDVVAESRTSSLSSQRFINVEGTRALSYDHWSGERTNVDDTEGDSSPSSHSEGNVADSNELSHDHQSNDRSYHDESIESGSSSSSSSSSSQSDINVEHSSEQPHDHSSHEKRNNTGLDSDSSSSSQSDTHVVDASDLQHDHRPDARIKRDDMESESSSSSQSDNNAKDANELSQNRQPGERIYNNDTESSSSSSQSVANAEKPRVRSHHHDSPSKKNIEGDGIKRDHSSISSASSQSDGSAQDTSQLSQYGESEKMTWNDGLGNDSCSSSQSAFKVEDIIELPHDVDTSRDDEMLDAFIPSESFASADTRNEESSGSGSSNSNRDGSNMTLGIAESSHSIGGNSYSEDGESAKGSMNGSFSSKQSPKSTGTTNSGNRKLGINNRCSSSRENLATDLSHTDPSDESSAQSTDSRGCCDDSSLSNHHDESASTSASEISTGMGDERSDNTHTTMSDTSKIEYPGLNMRSEDEDDGAEQGFVDLKTKATFTTKANKENASVSTSDQSDSHGSDQAGTAREFDNCGFMKDSKIRNNGINFEADSDTPQIKHCRRSFDRSAMAKALVEYSSGRRTFGSNSESSDSRDRNSNLVLSTDAALTAFEQEDYSCEDTTDTSLLDADDLSGGNRPDEDWLKSADSALAALQERLGMQEGESENNSVEEGSLGSEEDPDWLQSAVSALAAQKLQEATTEENSDEDNNEFQEWDGSTSDKHVIDDNWFGSADAALAAIQRKHQERNESDSSSHTNESSTQNDWQSEVVQAADSRWSKAREAEGAFLQPAGSQKVDNDWLNSADKVLETLQQKIAKKDDDESNVSQEDGSDWHPETLDTESEADDDDNDWQRAVVDAAEERWTQRAPKNEKREEGEDEPELVTSDWFGSADAALEALQQKFEPEIPASQSSSDSTDSDLNDVSEKSNVSETSTQSGIEVISRYSGQSTNLNVLNNDEGSITASDSNSNIWDIEGDDSQSESPRNEIDGDDSSSRYCAQHTGSDTSTQSEIDFISGHDRSSTGSDSNSNIWDIDDDGSQPTSSDNDSESSDGMKSILDEESTMCMIEEDEESFSSSGDQDSKESRSSSGNTPGSTHSYFEAEKPDGSTFDKVPLNISAGVAADSGADDIGHARHAKNSDRFSAVAHDTYRDTVETNAPKLSYNSKSAESSKVAEPNVHMKVLPWKAESDDFGGFADIESGLPEKKGFSDNDPVEQEEAASVYSLESESTNSPAEKNKRKLLFLILAVLCFAILVGILLIPWLLRAGDKDSSEDVRPPSMFTTIVPPTPTPLIVPSLSPATPALTWILDKNVVGSRGTGFGASVAIDADVALVAESATEVVRSFHRDDNSVGIWQEVESVELEKKGSQFGKAVDVVNQRMVVGAPSTFAEGTSISTGAAYFYLYDPLSLKWQQVGDGFSGDTDIVSSAGEEFGAACAVSAAYRVVVGAPKSSLQATEAGRVYTFEYRPQSLQSWASLEILPLTGATAGDRFGSSVSITKDSSRILVGSPESGTREAGSRRAGSASMYRWAEGDWELLHTWEGSNGDDNESEEFGSSVSFLSGSADAIAIGAPAFQGQAGRIIVLKKQDSTEEYAQVGPAIVGNLGDNLGLPGCVSGGITQDELSLVVGTATGQVKRFDYNVETGVWQQDYQAVSSSPFSPSRVAFSSTDITETLLVGSSGSDEAFFYSINKTDVLSSSTNAPSSITTPEPTPTVIQNTSSPSVSNLVNSPSFPPFGVISTLAPSVGEKEDPTASLSMSPTTTSPSVAPTLTPTISPTTLPTVSPQSLSPTMSIPDLPDAPSPGPTFNVRPGTWVRSGGPFRLQSGFKFGSSVASADSEMAVGAPEALDLGVVLIFNKESGMWGSVQTQQLVGNQQGAKFGEAVDMVDDAMIIGAPGTRGENSNTSGGAVWMYQKIDEWVQIGSMLMGETGLLGENEQFGADVATSRVSRIAVGAPGSSVDSRPERGRVYVYEFDTDTSEWMPTESILGSESGESFGSAVDISLNGNFLVVGAPGNGTNHGQTTIYQYNVFSWFAITTVSGEEANEKIGSSVKFLNEDGSIVAVGAPGYQNGRGRVVVYKRDGSTGRFSQLGASIVGGLGDRIGSSKRISGAVSGADMYVMAGTTTGLVRVFKYDRDTSEWSQAFGSADTGFRRSAGLLALATPPSLSPGTISFSVGGDDAAAIFDLQS